MGSAFTAVADDITSIWWNPAGLGFLENTEVMFTMVDYTLELTYSYGAAAWPLMDGNLVLGAFMGYLDVPEMEITTVYNPDGTGSFFNAYDLQAGASMAYNLSDRFVAGMNVKFVHQDVWNNIGGSAFAMDIGSIYHTELMDREIKFAFVIQNLGTNITMRGPNLLEEIGPEARNGLFPDGYGDFTTDREAISRRATRQAYLRTHTYRLPTVMKISLAYNLYTGESTNFLSCGELWRNNNMPISYALGTELTHSFNPRISGSLRAGWQIQSDEYNEDADAFGYSYWGDDPVLRGLSIGGGVKREFYGKTIEFNYAYRNKGRLSADNFFTVTLGF
jgi:hypothetical protein